MIKQDYHFVTLNEMNWCFWTVMQEKTLENPWTARRSNLINPKGNQPWIFSLEGLMLKLQYFDHLLQRANSLEKTLMLGKIEGKRRSDRGWDGWMISPTRWTRIWTSSRRWWRTGKPIVLQLMGSQKVGHNLATEQQQQWNNGHRQQTSMADKTNSWRGDKKIYVVYHKLYQVDNISTQ